MNEYYQLAPEEMYHYLIETVHDAAKEVIPHRTPEGGGGSSRKPRSKRSRNGLSQSLRRLKGLIQVPAAFRTLPQNIIARDNLRKKLKEERSITLMQQNLEKGS